MSFKIKIRWKPDGIDELPECMKICFWTLFNTTEEMAIEIQKEKGWSRVLPYLHNKVNELNKLPSGFISILNVQSFSK